jgi:hypothetical protein
MMRSARSSTRPGYLAYAGRFKVDEAASIVEHRVSVSLFPKWIGDVQKRRVDLDGDDLVLESPAITGAAGTSVTPRLRWRRLTSSCGRPGPTTPPR